MTSKFLTMALTGLVLVACNAPSPETGHTIEGLAGPAIQRFHDPKQVALGEKVYRQHCASCHGAKAEGDPNWRQRGADGKYPPPALNGSAHAWHHPVAVLRQVIAKGSPQGKGNMPAWEGKLTEEEMDAVIVWFQSLWPDRVYAAWYEAQQRR